MWGLLCVNVCVRVALVKLADIDIPLTVENAIFMAYKLPVKLVIVVRLDDLIGMT